MVHVPKKPKLDPSVQPLSLFSPVLEPYNLGTGHGRLLAEAEPKLLGEAVKVNVYFESCVMGFRGLAGFGNGCGDDGPRSACP